MSENKNVREKEDKKAGTDMEFVKKKPIVIINHAEIKNVDKNVTEQSSP